MTITFKNVGQGDSIIIEYPKDGQSRVILIDCRLKPDGSNPVLDFIRNNNIKEIDLVVISHPHADHCDGFPQLLEFCYHNVHIKNFAHECHPVKDRLNRFNFSATDITLIAEIFQHLDRFNKNKGSRILSMSGSLVRTIPLGDYALTFLAPEEKHIAKFEKSQFKTGLDQDDNSDANILSTFWEISKDDKYALLCADAPATVFNSIMKSVDHSKLQLIMGQAPHHGSKHNHVLKFWQRRKGLSIPIIISVGDNPYDHPHDKVVDELTKEGYDVLFTNNPKTRASPLLAAFSTVLPTAGDLKFDFSTGIVVRT